ncbi:MAG: rRNA maturation RNase YbeY [Leptolyngbyaceae cyanobacterium SM1_1_3]|nr:rRNA maturation RNase YbeY [Leptolyngbyaceae cyanobacterium SM1_1_3]NJN03720.1 rRNA maturation RNase YbeY [Leptolyngbyaceae cyanobacterium RM1_1_2]NJO09348.1 rRNA maturation RNase YbeY [Leptolyngbyaceae cyanobacterium SL_1_1]
MNISLPAKSAAQIEIAFEVEDLALAEEVPNLPWQSWFQTWIAQLQPQRSPIGAYELGLRLTSDRQIQQLNSQYRSKDTPTDVLAFAALEDSAPLVEELLATQPLYLGDIVISLETAAVQAAQHHSLRQELAWLAAHGLLHLLGWDHPDEVQLEQMLTKQQQLLQAIGMVSR